MISKSPVTVRRTSWHADSGVMTAIRRAVFVVEQHVPEEDEWDGMDVVSQHVIALTFDGEVVGTGRLLPDGRIGRMAVLKGWRECGVGSALLRELITMARANGFYETRLHAQKYALDFYRKHGYTTVGDEFIEAGIPHYEMSLLLKGPDENGW